MQLEHIVRVAAAIVLALGFTTGCGLDGTYTGLGDGALPGDPLNPWPLAVTCDCGGGGACPTADVATGEVDNGALDVDDLTGLGWRFDSMVVTSPDLASFDGLLNGYFADNIANESFNVLLLALADDRDAGTLQLRVGAGTKGDDGYGMSSGAGTLDCSLTGGRFATSEPITFDFPNDFLTPPVLPLQQVTVSGLLAPDASSITEGALIGALSEADAEATKIANTMVMADLLNHQVKAPMDVDLDGDGTPDAWRFVFTFTAAAAIVSE
jgi:hypothetical protein